LCRRVDFISPVLVFASTAATPTTGTLPAPSLRGRVPTRVLVHRTSSVPTRRGEATYRSLSLAPFLRCLPSLTTGFASGRRCELPLGKEGLFTRCEDEGGLAVTANEGLVAGVSHFPLALRASEMKALLSWLFLLSSVEYAVNIRVPFCFDPTQLLAEEARSDGELLKQ